MAVALLAASAIFFSAAFDSKQEPAWAQSGTFYGLNCTQESLQALEERVAFTLSDDGNGKLAGNAELRYSFSNRDTAAANATLWIPVAAAASSQGAPEIPSAYLGNTITDGKLIMLPYADYTTQKLPSYTDAVRFNTVEYTPESFAATALFTRYTAISDGEITARVNKDAGIIIASGFGSYFSHGEEVEFTGGKTTAVVYASGSAQIDFYASGSKISHFKDENVTGRDMLIDIAGVVKDPEGVIPPDYLSNGYSYIQAYNLTASIIENRLSSGGNIAVAPKTEELYCGLCYAVYDISVAHSSVNTFIAQIPFSVTAADAYISLNIAAGNFTSSDALRSVTVNDDCPRFVYAGDGVEKSSNAFLLKKDSAALKFGVSEYAPGKLNHGYLAAAIVSLCLTLAALVAAFIFTFINKKTPQ